ncbi:MAG TPA: OmpA family protein [Phycisphaerae bacterium]|mgnify:CR=1 FL=1|nr:OmpA family protein [Phycisphaerae bacterium]HPS52598.1 OmpA family protein [Phycisphaerae bacterium]
MKKWTVSCMAVALCAFGVIGCNEREKGQIAALTERVDSLQAQNKNLNDRNVELEKQVDQYKMEIEDKNMQLAQKDKMIKDLEGNLGKTKNEEVTVIKNPAGWEVGMNGAKLTIGSDILFNSGKASLTSSGKSKLAQAYRDIQNNYGGWSVRVFGYTDSDPIRKSKWKDNLELSGERAMSVTRYLTSQGISPDLVETIGMGATHFVASNSSRSGKAQNRRVEIVVVKPTK